MLFDESMLGLSTSSPNVRAALLPTAPFNSQSCSNCGIFQIWLIVYMPWCSNNWWYFWLTRFVFVKHYNLSSLTIYNYKSGLLIFRIGPPLSYIHSQLTWSPSLSAAIYLSCSWSSQLTYTLAQLVWCLKVFIHLLMLPTRYDFYHT